ncbi:ras-like GTP-binding protein rhoA [Condylostylus longicornis]|uniref:ras-like GTP-binding protein rhoA n=1 Tax=Condylostylus longicornis TaxID=2530218 RepID=UPI00244DD3C1|nr:ras-like GTP-binding protein rhoA [Condylostylus longicornis]
MSKREMTDSLERPGLFKELKVVLVGPAKCGKTALIHRFVNETFSDNYVPTGFEKYSTKRRIGDFTIEYSIWDTSGSGSYDTVRPLAYQDAQIFILCFSISEPDTLQLTLNKWLPEIKSHCPNTPIILCGCKADSRYNSNSTTTGTTTTPNHLNSSHNDFDNSTNFYINQQAAIEQEQARIACQQFNGIAYIETCSRYPSPGIDEMFELAAQTALDITEISSIPSSKTSTKKRKTYSISTSTLGKSSTQSVEKSMHNCNNKSTHLKPDIRKGTKNCSLM